MELPIHVEPPSRHGFARWIPAVRAVAMLSLGVGIGVLAAIPLGGEGALPTVVAVATAAVAAALVVLVPNNTAAVATADVLLGVAVVASVFGRLGPLYIPLLLVFFAVTARVERPARHAGARLPWSPAPEFEQGARPPVAPLTRQAESVWMPPFEPQVVGSTDLSQPVWLAADAPDRPAWLPPGSARPNWMVAGDFEATASDNDVAAHAPPSEPDPAVTVEHRVGPAAVALPRPVQVAPAPTHRVGPAGVARPRAVVVPDATLAPGAAEPTPAPTMIERPAAAVATTTTTAAAAAARGRRNRRPGPILPRRMVSAAVRARRVLGDHARIGLGNLRDALTEAPQIDLLLPPRPPENEPAKPRSRRVMVLPASEPVQPQRDLGDRELDAMGAGRLAMADSPASSRHRISARARRPRPRPHGANGAAGGAA